MGSPTPIYKPSTLAISTMAFDALLTESIGGVSNIGEPPTPIPMFTWMGMLDASTHAFTKVTALATFHGMFLLGFVFTTGFCGHGFGLAPVIGRLISELILDCKTSIPIHDFCYGRLHKDSGNECSCNGNAACTTVTAVCPNKREWLKSI